MSKLKFGWAEVSITPDKKISLAGQFAERISEYVEKPITATALAIESDRDQAVLVSVDLEGMGYNLVEAVRQNLKNNTVGLDPAKTVYSVIHTHTGPEYICNNRTAEVLGKEAGLRYYFESNLPADKRFVERVNISHNDEVMNEREVTDFLIDRLTKVTLQAWNNRKAGAFSNAFGRAAVGMCRRVVYSDGSAQMWGDTNTAMFSELEGGNDSGIELLYLFDESEKLTGVVANIACPAQCVQHRKFVSPDYWGEVKKLLRERFGEDIYLLCLCSAAGDQCPVDLVRWVEPESDINDPNCTRVNPLKRHADPSMFDLAGMYKAGRRVATEIIGVYEDGLDAALDDVPFEHRVEMMQLPVRRVTLAEIAAAKKAIKEYLDTKGEEVDFNDTAALQVHLGILRRAKLQELMDVMDTEVHIIRLGPISIATSPFELFLDYGNQIRARAKSEQTFLIQLANGAEGYLPTEKAERGGHYSAFVSSGTVGHVGGEMLVRQTLKNINEMFED